MSEVVVVVLLSLLAGAATGIGGFIAITFKPGRRLFGFMMGFAGGVMITLALFELVAEAWNAIGPTAAAAAFALGAFLMFAFDSLLPHIRFDVKELGVASIRLYKMGLLFAVGVALHNIPEGIAVGAGYLHMPALGILVAIAVAVHNIPEGLAIALPIYAASVAKGAARARDAAIKYAVLAGLVEPIGALGAALFLTGFATFIVAALAFAGGVMFFITLDELVPMARERGHEHYTPFGIILGALFTYLLLGAANV